MPIDPHRPPLVIFGCGYVGDRLARVALAAGRPVRVCARNVARLEPLRELGAEVFPIDAAKPKQFGPALTGTMSSSVVYSIPPVAGMPAGEALRRAAQAALSYGVRSFIYLGSTGLYGTRPDADWVDEDTNVAHDDGQMAARLSDEGAVQSATSAGLHTVILRLAAIYGPGRGVRARLRAGTFKMVDDGVHWVSRIYIDDLVSVILAADEKAPAGATYLVADDRPTQQKEYTSWMCERLGLPLPRSVPAYGSGTARTLLRGRRIRNDLMKRELGITLRYPTFVEGELQIEAEEAAIGAADSVPVTVDDALSVAVPLGSRRDNSADAVKEVSLGSRGDNSADAVKEVSVPVAVPVARPDCIRHLAAFPRSADRYPGSDEELASYAALAQPLGLRRLGVNHAILPPGHRTSWPHAHSAEEELVYVLSGTPDLWLDGHLHRLGPGDVIGFPAGTGSSHTLLNNSANDATLLSIGEHDRRGDRTLYPLHPARQASLADARRWDDPPRRELGPHDGLPSADAQRRK
ncbi:MAG: cupin domain-containing protein [Myxococcales bacterium]|nr:cupin domain-containing protein [Myxococcales bacterium]